MASYSHRNPDLHRGRQEERAMDGSTCWTSVYHIFSAQGTVLTKCLRSQVDHFMFGEAGSREGQEEEGEKEKL